MCHGGRWLAGLGLGCLVVLTMSGRSIADMPLHEKIDRAIEDGREGRLASAATDGEFLRRASLDLTGMIPTVSEARSFLDDPSPYKRAKLIDRLLASPEYARRMQIVFDVMLMERRPDKHVPSADWDEYLRESFARNKPYDQLVREILAADGSEPDRRAPAKFVLDREADPNLLTRDVGRLFLGRDFQCAQCHDHPLIDDYKQAHYYGLFAFFSRSYLVTDASNVTSLAEKADGDVTFASVFKKKITHKTGPHVLDAPEITEPAVAKGQEYWVYPADKVRAIPRHSRRAGLPSHLASPEVPEFSRNIVNRLWALMMGRGLVQPLDFQHEDNPPSHPELLEMLANEFVALRYDVKAFLRELSLTRTYQRSSEPAPDMSESDLAPSTFAVANLKPLSPEQLAFSVMQATGIIEQTRKQVERQLLVSDPRFGELVRLDSKRQTLGAETIERALFDRLKGNLNPFIKQFGGIAGQSQDGGQSTVHQALFLSNGQPVQGWLAPSGENLTARLAKLTDPSALAEELYLALLTRRPTAEERAEVADYLEKRGTERTQAIQELAWALLASTEFRFNH